MEAGVRRFIQESFAPVYADQGDQWIHEPDRIEEIGVSDRVHLCDGSDQEYQLMMRLMLQSGTAISLNPRLR